MGKRTDRRKTDPGPDLPEEEGVECYHAMIEAWQRATVAAAALEALQERLSPMGPVGDGYDGDALLEGAIEEVKEAARILDDATAGRERA